ncbi:MAG TPA: transcriptional regulator [Bacteroidetes bacterium]|nr:transcriptional regulator [Bacteroidota bacterium]
MDKAENKIASLKKKRENAAIQVQTLGSFQVWRNGEKVTSKEWGRDKTVQLFQFLVTSRHRNALHKEQIIDRLWDEAGDQNFKVAMHGLNKVLEPNRKSRSDARFIIRQGLTYQLNLEEMWIDADALEQYSALGNQCLADEPEAAIAAYRAAVALLHGAYLPNRLYEDWSSAEREHLQVLALGTTITLGELLLDKNPLESIRLAQQALLIDPTWEDAYRLEMLAYLKKGNRPMAIKTYRQCEKILQKEFGIPPLPATKKLMKEILQVGSGGAFQNFGAG